jgi:hypothetical protein
MEEIESVLLGVDPTNSKSAKPGMCSTINYRTRLWDERLKRCPCKDKKKENNEIRYFTFWDTGRETPYFVLAGRVAVLLWIVLIVSVLVQIVN